MKCAEVLVAQICERVAQSCAIIKDANALQVCEGVDVPWDEREVTQDERQLAFSLELLPDRLAACAQRPEPTLGNDISVYAQHPRNFTTCFNMAERLFDLLGTGPEPAQRPSGKGVGHLLSFAEKLAADVRRAASSPETRTLFNISYDAHGFVLICRSGFAELWQSYNGRFSVALSVKQKRVYDPGWIEELLKDMVGDTSAEDDAARRARHAQEELFSGVIRRKELSDLEKEFGAVPWKFSDVETFAYRKATLVNDCKIYSKLKARMTANFQYFPMSQRR